ncbi:hypothetical protein PFTANZ_01512 [Plasmodium falciparum Tanzania (2000708)]|uniref:Uncharacterized protein n=1 Tax=Plasmodium falciparum Tanzania (2000708) TaxID=1036725 RepID=A0A024WA26_PLAFA|nr:hypothetical protein PFTANZ_01512 [Plasmodium falciparum Tanzania (2000708)]
MNIVNEAEEFEDYHFLSYPVSQIEIYRRNVHDINKTDDKDNHNKDKVDEDKQINSTDDKDKKNNSTCQEQKEKETVVKKGKQDEPSVHKEKELKDQENKEHVNEKDNKKKDILDQNFKEKDINEEATVIEEENKQTKINCMKENENIGDIEKNLTSNNIMKYNELSNPILLNFMLLTNIQKEKNIKKCEKDNIKNKISDIYLLLSIQFIYNYLNTSDDDLNNMNISFFKVSNYNFLYIYWNIINVHINNLYLRIITLKLLVNLTLLLRKNWQIKLKALYAKWNIKCVKYFGITNVKKEWCVKELNFMKNILKLNFYDTTRSLIVYKEIKSGIQSVNDKYKKKLEEYLDTFN